MASFGGDDTFICLRVIRHLAFAFAFAARFVVAVDAAGLPSGSWGIGARDRSERAC